MSGHTKTGLLLLMIALGIALLVTPITYGLYSTINFTDLQGQFPSILMILTPILLIGIVAGIFYLLGAIFIFLGRKEFGEKHRKYIIYCCVLICVILGVIVFFSFSMIVSSFSWIFAAHSQSTPEQIDFFTTQLTYSLIQSFIVAVLSGLVWVLAVYNLENKKGRTILFAAFIFLILAPMVNSIGSFMTLDDWVKEGTLDGLFNNTTSTPQYSQLITLSQWSGVPGFIMLLCSLMSNLLLLVALFIAYKRITNGELTSPASTDMISHP